MSVGERGPGGPAGERGKTGDHGQDGQEGPQGDPGEQGPQGERYSSWITRNAVKAYCILAAGLILAVGMMAYGFDRTTKRIDRVAAEACKSGNLRSDLQRDDFLESQKMTQTLDLANLLGITAEQEAEFRRLSRESTERRIARLPYVNCKTGERLYPPTSTTVQR